MLRIAITGATGQVAYSLIFRIANGELFGKEKPFCLNVFANSKNNSILNGLVMELEDCIFPSISKINITYNLEKTFENVNMAILLGAKPRNLGMERKNLLKDNGKIFAAQGKAINKACSKDVIVFVVGNPCNTNCLITMHNAPDIPSEQFFSMMRLDQNRAQFQLAKKANVNIEEVGDVVVWGNHSKTQVPDFLNARIKGKKVTDVIDRSWLEKEFLGMVQKRGDLIIANRGKSSGGSAANAILEDLKAIYNNNHNPFSLAILSNGNPYGIEKNLIFSFPCIKTDSKKIKIVDNFIWDSFIEKKIIETQKELLEERNLIRHLI